MEATACKGKRVLIFTGGNLGPWALPEIKENDFLLGVDRGAYFLLRHNFQPDYVMGDFDSVTESEFSEIRNRCGDIFSCDPVDKDLTDTEMAFDWAISGKPGAILLLGAVGSRLDHTIANVQLLYKGLQTGVPCRLVDEKNEVTIINRPTQVSKGRYHHISLLPFSREASGITLEGFRYPLNRASLKTGTGLGISNILVADEGKIYLESGELLVVKSMD